MFGAHQSVHSACDSHSTAPSKVLHHSLLDRQIRDGKIWGRFFVLVCRVRATAWFLSLSLFLCPAFLTAEMSHHTGPDLAGRRLVLRHRHVPGRRHGGAQRGRAGRHTQLHDCGTGQHLLGRVLRRVWGAGAAHIRIGVHVLVRDGRRVCGLHHWLEYDSGVSDW